MNETKEVKDTDIKQEERTASPARRREIIKTITIIFLAAMLILTFFSNTIMNRSLSEISTETAVSGKLTERVRGSGLVESNQTYEVTVSGNKVIDTILVKTGQEVKKDDVLFTVGAVTSAELAEAEETLDTLELDYQKALCSEPTDYSEENQAIKNAREDLTAAIEKRDAAASTDTAAAAAKTEYTANKNELTKKTSTQSKLTTTISALDTDDYASAAAEYTGDLPTLYSNYSAAASEYQAAYDTYTQLSAEGMDASSALSDANAKQSVRDSKKAEYDAEKSRIRADLTSQLTAVNAEIETLTEATTAYEETYGSSTSATYEECVADVQSKQRTLEDLIISLNKTQNTDYVSNEVSNLELEAKKSAVDKQKEKVEKLKEESAATEIKSKYSGVVSSINVKPDETTVEGTPLAVIDLSDEGYTVKITVDGEKAKKVKKGTSAEVTNNWGGDIEAVVKDIKNDTVSGSKNRILEFSVTGDVESGSYLDLSIPCGSGNYDAIVPKSAVYQDNKGSFVLTVKSKSTPFGNRYYAERVNVEVLASDESSSAVSGSINANDYVITAASKPVSPGDQVRMKDK